MVGSSSSSPPPLFTVLGVHVLSSFSRSCLDNARIVAFHQTFQATPHGRVEDGRSLQLTVVAVASGPNFRYRQFLSDTANLHNIYIYTYICRCIKYAYMYIFLSPCTSRNQGVAIYAQRKSCKATFWAAEPTGWDHAGATNYASESWFCR